MSEPATPLPAAAPVIDNRARLVDPAVERAAVLAGLRSRPRQVSPRYFYDARGSRLFERITELPEYYPTRAERAILEAEAPRLAERTRAVQLVELGSGSAAKTRLLLDALTAAGTLATYVPLDVSEAALRQSALALAASYADLRVHGIVGDFEDLAPLPPAGGPRLTLFLGGTIGNLHPADEAPALLARVAAALAPGDWFLLGVDLVKDRRTLEAAYDDAAGVTAEFNRNLLRVLDDRFGFGFEPERFDHLARWDEANRWIEMHLVAREAHRVPMGPGEEPLHLAAGETIRTEISAKFDAVRVAGLLAATPFVESERLVDPEGLFALHLWRRR